MGEVIFISTVSNEFHHKDIRNPQAFDSYRTFLKQSLRVWDRNCNVLEDVVDQEELQQGFGDLLGTLDTEISRSTIVIHLVGEMAGESPQPASLRRLKERHPRLLHHEPELADQIGDGIDVAYTQWEAYLAFEHQCGRLFYKASSAAPRSPHFRLDPHQQMSQSRHAERLEIVGEFPEIIQDHRELAQKAIESIERFGLRASSQTSRPSREALERAKAEAAVLTFEIGSALRKNATKAISDFDPAGIAAFLQAIDTATLERELDRRATLEIVHDHRDELRRTIAVTPTVAGLYDLALAELSVANYRQAMNVAQQSAELALISLASEPRLQESFREQALNAFLLRYEAAQFAGRRDDAIASLEEGGALIDRDGDPVLWADYHETLAGYFLDQALFDKAEPLIDEIIDIRESQGESNPALPASLLLWCRLLDVRAKNQSVVEVAARAERLFAQQSPLNRGGIVSTLRRRAGAPFNLSRFREAEPLMEISEEERSRRVLAAGFDPIWLNNEQEQS